MKKRVLCIVLVCVLLAGIVTTGFVAYGPANNAEEERQVSDYFYIQIYNADNQVASKYKVTLTGTVSGRNRKIDSVDCELEFGDACETVSKINGDMVGILITHPTEGYLVRAFVLNENGEFAEY